MKTALKALREAMVGTRYFGTDADYAVLPAMHPLVDCELAAAALQRPGLNDATVENLTTTMWEAACAIDDAAVVDAARFLATFGINRHVTSLYVPRTCVVAAANLRSRGDSELRRLFFARLSCAWAEQFRRRDIDSEVTLWELTHSTNAVIVGLARDGIDGSGGMRQLACSPRSTPRCV